MRTPNPPRRASRHATSYAPQLARWLEHWPAPRVLAMQSEHLLAEPQQAMATVARFLALRPYTAAELATFTELGTHHLEHEVVADDDDGGEGGGGAAGGGGGGDDDGGGTRRRARASRTARRRGRTRRRRRRRATTAAEAMSGSDDAQGRGGDADSGAGGGSGLVASSSVGLEDELIDCDRDALVEFFSAYEVRARGVWRVPETPRGCEKPPVLPQLCERANRSTTHHTHSP
jgi:hypothetical protein